MANRTIKEISFCATHIELDYDKIENGEIQWYLPSLKVDDFIFYECENISISDFQKTHPDCVDYFQIGNSIIYINKEQAPLISNKTFFQHIKEGCKNFSDRTYVDFIHKYGECNFNDFLIKYGCYIGEYEYIDSYEGLSSKSVRASKHSIVDAYESIKEQNLKFSSFEEMFNILSLKTRGENLEDNISVDILEQYLSEYFVSYKENKLYNIPDYCSHDEKNSTISYYAGFYMLPQIRLKNLKHFFEEQGRQDLLNVINKYQKLHHLRDIEYLFKVNQKIENVQLKNGGNVIVMNITDKSEDCYSVRDFISKYPYGQESLQILIYPSGKEYYRYANKKLDGSVEIVKSLSPYEIMCSIKNYDFFKHISEKVNIINFFDKINYDWGDNEWRHFVSYYFNIQEKFIKENEIDSLLKLSSNKYKNTENELNTIPQNVNIDIGNLFLVPFNPNYNNNIKCDNIKWINVPFEEKDEVKSLGAKWNPNKKSWYITENENIEKFAKWLPEYEEQQEEDLER